MEEAQLIFAAAAICTLWVAYHIVWQTAVQNYFRQRLFELRGEFFMAAANGEVSFDDPLYGMVRSVMNRLIWGLAGVCFSRAILFRIFRPLVAKEGAYERPLILPTKIRLAIDHLNESDPEKAEIYRSYFARSMVLSACYFLTWLPFIGILVYVLGSLVILIATVAAARTAAWTAPRLAMAAQQFSDSLRNVTELVGVGVVAPIVEPPGDAENCPYEAVVT